MTDRIKRPVFIVGHPRSGTLLMSRIIGGHNQHFLITEHKNKTRYVPEEQFDRRDNELWYEFLYPAEWRRDEKKSKIEPPISAYKEKGSDMLRSLYLESAHGKRLIIKNPSNIFRIPIIKKMFPDALFIFCARNPWHTVQSVITKDKDSFFLKTKEIFEFTSDRFLRAFVSWREACRFYLNERDENWLTIRHEDVVSNPKETIGKIFDFLGMERNDYYDVAIQKPMTRNKNYYYLKKLFRKSKHQKEITDVITPFCELFSYDSSVESLEGGALGYYVEKYKRKLLSFCKRMKRKLKRIQKIFR